jgi:hypothetical protein
VDQPRRSRTDEYRRLVAEPCKAGKLSLQGYRWAAYLYGGETGVSLRTYTTTGRYDSLLARRTGGCAAFRQSLHDEGYNGLPDRDVECNIYVPRDILPDFPIGRAIPEYLAQEYIHQYPIPRWVDRNSPLYRGWKLWRPPMEGRADSRGAPTNQRSRPGVHANHLLPPNTTTQAYTYTINTIGFTLVSLPFQDITA